MSKFAKKQLTAASPVAALTPKPVQQLAAHRKQKSLIAPRNNRRWLRCCSHQKAPRSQR
jgi:hypothetical protein